MRTPPAGAAISNLQNAEADEYETYTPKASAAQVSRPSTLRTPDEARAARALWLFDTKVWLKSPPGQPMPQLGAYGCNLDTPSSDEVLAMAGGGS